MKNKSRSLPTIVEGDPQQQLLAKVQQFRIQTFTVTKAEYLVLYRWGPQTDLMKTRYLASFSDFHRIGEAVTLNSFKKIFKQYFLQPPTILVPTQLIKKIITKMHQYNLVGPFN